MTNYEFEPNRVSLDLQKPNHTPPCPNFTTNIFQRCQTLNERKTADTQRITKTLIRGHRLREAIGPLINIQIVQR